MAECNHDCASCASNGSCGDKSASPRKEAANAKSNVKKVVAVMSGKGGVGKSLVTEMLAVAAAKKGLKVAILDADITGPSIPTAFGVGDRAAADQDGNILPCRSALGVKVMSLNLIIDNPRDPVVWRGPILAGVVKQFWTDVNWGDIDVMFVDMPPGTGDVPLTVFQSLPVTSAVVVTTPQDLVSLIVEKALRLARMLNVPVAGLVENMAYFTCAKCGEKHRIFGDGNAEDIAAAHGANAVASLPIDPALSRLVDEGHIEAADVSLLDPILAAI